MKDSLGFLCGTTTHSGSDVDMVAFWTFSLVLATCLLYLVAKNQLSGISKTAKADFIKKFNNEFYTEATRNIIMLLDYGALIYKEKEIVSGNSSQTYNYFEIDQNVLDQFELCEKTRNELKNRLVYSSYELDDLLIGKFEDIGLFEKRHFLNINDVCNQFYWYINLVWNNVEIQKYISSQRKSDGDWIYSEFERIYMKCFKTNMVNALWIALKKRIRGLCE